MAENSRQSKLTDKVMDLSKQKFDFYILVNI